MKKIVITIVKENDLYSFRNLKDSKKSMGIVIFFWKWPMYGKTLQKRENRIMLVK